jgi:hypothetical protein
MLSLGTATLAAGSACAIASLWPVDDAATGHLEAARDGGRSEPVHGLGC